MPLLFDLVSICKTSGLGKSEVLTTCVASGATSVFDPVAFLEEERAALVATLFAPPDLMSTTAPPPRWTPGDFRPAWSIAELRAFGMSWAEIERFVMSSPVRWEPGDLEVMHDDDGTH